MTEQIQNKIKEMISQNNIFLFMKGSPTFPQCGFSARVVGVLKELNVNFKSFDVLEDEEIRQGIKEYSQWPTIPQLYINREFIGGCDIVIEMLESGELEEVCCKT